MQLSEWVYILKKIYFVKKVYIENSWARKCKMKKKAKHATEEGMA